MAPCRACLVAIADYQDNQSLERFARQRPDLFVPIAGLNPVAYGDESQIDTEVGRLHARGFAGIKLHPRLNSYDPLDPRCLAAVAAAGTHGLPVFLDTLFRQRGRRTRHPADVVDAIITQAPKTRIVLLHGGGAHLLGLFEIVRLHDNLVLDLSFTLLRYAGSSLDFDVRFVCETLDRRLTVGSDFPEYLPSTALARITKLTEGLSREKMENILFGNLERLFRDWPGLPQIGPTD